MASDRSPLVCTVGADRLGRAERVGRRPVVAVVPAGVALDTPDALGLVRRADLLAPATAAEAEAVAAVVPVAPWDMLVGPDPSPDRIAAARARLAGRPHPLRRLALVTPLPPEPTGVADYSARLAIALAARLEVTCVVAQPGAAAPAGCMVIDVATFEARAAGGCFDEIVHVLGNQPRHGTQLALLRRHPGAVQLHDVRLVGAYAGLYAPGDALADELARLEPGRFDADLLREPALRMGPSVEAGVWMVREAAQRATVVLTHSAHAADLVAAEAGVDAIDVGPLACPVVTTPRAEPGPGDEPLVVSVGVVDASKRPDALVRALADAPGDAWLALVGPVDDAYRHELRGLADRCGVGARVVLTGRVDDEAYAGWLRRAAVAVQLRAHSNGESSAAVADCLAHGVPTVVGARGSLAELPADAAVAVAADGADLGPVLAGLLGDPGRRRRLHHGALAFAAANGFPAAGDRLLTALFGPAGT